ncbi:MAG: XRE family transcriptional regulator [Candidatus Acidiferrales bacterium]
MSRMKFSQLAKRTMKPESLARGRKKAQLAMAAMEIAELRDSLKITQTHLAKRLKVSQAAISKLERKSRNIHINQLRAMIAAMGGELRIVAVFPGKSVQLNHVGK